MSLVNIRSFDVFVFNREGTELHKEKGITGVRETGHKVGFHYLRLCVARVNKNIVNLCVLNLLS